MKLKLLVLQERKLGTGVGDFIDAGGAYDLLDELPQPLSALLPVQHLAVDGNLRVQCLHTKRTRFEDRKSSFRKYTTLSL